ncbi:hypothetical protein Pmani_005835 [Petrolisthes manimaculis]|uniref:Uncharacterized protein n=1 Tax=Petrolisthes manimaculis TaxID=1843537 RepID=A0AAE1QD04_9EUCA|nr:hypothetical protein Pmani_005835 [Petrolisthes manimaculis]
MAPRNAHKNLHQSPGTDQESREYIQYIDTDPEDIKCTVIKKPVKFIFSEEEEADVEDNDYPGTCYTSTVAVLPRPPHHGGHTSTTSVLPQPSQHGGHTSTTSVLPQPPQHGEGKAAPSNSSRCPKRSVFTTPKRFDTSSRDCSPVPEQPKYIRMQNGKGKSMSVSSSEGGSCRYDFTMYCTLMIVCYKEKIIH